MSLSLANKKLSYMKKILLFVVIVLICTNISGQQDYKEVTFASPDATSFG